MMIKKAQSLQLNIKENVILKNIVVKINTEFRDSALDSTLISAFPEISVGNI